MSGRGLRPVAAGALLIGSRRFLVGLDTDYVRHRIKQSPAQRLYPLVDHGGARPTPSRLNSLSRMSLHVLRHEFDRGLLVLAGGHAFQLTEMTIEIGKIVGLLHKNGIIHGDLTTSNFIFSKKSLYLIDFGLANRTIKSDDHGVDLRLFKEILNSAHADIIDKAWANFLKGYAKSVGQKYCKKITDKVSIIESRGRYANVV